MRLVVRGLRSQLAGPFDLELAKGSCAAISGASGSGKSLFLRMIADLDVNDGEVLLDGVDRATFGAPDWRRNAVYTAAESGWWMERAIEHFPAAQVEAARALAAELGVGPAEIEGPVARLSTGERQRLSIVRALVLDPPVLLLDEPTGPLDPVAVRAVEAQLLVRMAAGTAIVIVTHDVQQGPRLSADCYRMAARRLERLA